MLNILRYWKNGFNNPNSTFYNKTMVATDSYSCYSCDTYSCYILFNHTILLKSQSSSLWTAFKLPNTCDGMVCFSIGTSENETFKKE